MTALSGSRPASFSKNRARQVSRILREGSVNPDFKQALEEAHQWRLLCVEPTQRCFDELQRICLPSDATVVFRLKRMSSIIAKLQRPAHYRLDELDDIGGCRIIVDTIERVNEIVKDIEQSRVLTVDGPQVKKDYIASPELSGYRGVHIIVRLEHEGKVHRVEIQVRTKLQHLWATSLEAEARHHNPLLKTGIPLEQYEDDDAQRAEFFMLVSDYLCIREKTRLREDSRLDVERDENSIRELLGGIGLASDIRDELRLFSEENILTLSDSKDSDEVASQGFVLLDFDFGAQTLKKEYFERDDLMAAVDAYDNEEKEFVTEDNSRPWGRDVVLIAADREQDIPKAFPNYFGGDDEFIQIVCELLKS
ncbi:RelA/SpoT domain-containing protein [Bifidobacterium bohemicum]|uniref:RelA/SpoT domain protein n=1 Tax=Bifidobacterium bohemicum DSM 22767 TaxID=1437606 RepID=A0A086ZE05_9BIFI|nr:RelA/SpoT domain-containing protein [Bifidobacterium bohemicum]KFI44755.1 RelA/SpoT domain protein [Bifidobacterium bohemicum DSM 22767]